MSGTARPKECSILWVDNFNKTARVDICLYPQQEWKYKIYAGTVRIEYECISLQIPKADFEKYRKVVE